MSQSKEQNQYETLAALNEMLQITQNYLLKYPSLFDNLGTNTSEDSQADNSDSIEELKRSLAARVKTLDPVLKRVII